LENFPELKSGKLAKIEGDDENKKREVGVE
jgi:hypothetical protein